MVLLLGIVLNIKRKSRKIAFFSPGNSDLLPATYCRPFGAVQLPPGALARQLKMRKDLDVLPASVAFAGDGLYRASMEVSLRTGYKAADRVLGKG